MRAVLFRVLNEKESFIPPTHDDGNRKTSKSLRVLYKILQDCALSQSPASHRPNPGFSWCSPCRKYSGQNDSGMVFFLAHGLEPANHLTFKLQTPHSSAVSKIEVSLFYITTSKLNTTQKISHILLFFCYNVNGKQL
jgi:hypothetical protein